MPRLSDPSGLSEAVLLPIDSGIQAISAGSGGRRDLLRVAGDAFRPELEGMLVHFLPQTKDCEEKEGTTDLRCGVRLLLEAAYEPVMIYVSEAQ